MDNKIMLIELIEKYRDILRNNPEYILCNQILTKIGASILAYNSDERKLEFKEIASFTDEEKAMFSSPDSLRRISALNDIQKYRGWREETAFSNLIQPLQQDILENRMHVFKKQSDSLDELFKIVDEGLYRDKYHLILDFIKLSVDNKMISITDAINLNFYVLNECSNYDVTLELKECETIVLQENKESAEEVREKIKEVFSKHGYVYDEVKMGDLDKEIVKYANVSYLDYILSKFKKYDISGNEIYIRKRALCNIVIDNDKEAFDSILNFIDKNECSLSTLLSMPAVFAKRKRNFVEKTNSSLGTNNNLFAVVGANQDFFENIALYKERAGIVTFKDSDLEDLGKFLCTPSSLVNKNLLLLETYGIITRGSLPKAITSLCGKHTEYIIDRLIEVGLYESYLSPRVTKDGKVKQPRGTYFLDRDNNPFKFYKMKMANDLGNSILASNGGILKVFKDNLESYMGVSLEFSEDGKANIVQEPLSLDVMNSINPKNRKSLPEPLQHRIDDGRISQNKVAYIIFKNLYKYRTFSPVDIFAASDRTLVTNLKGDTVASVLKDDYRDVITANEMRALELDSFIKLFDEAIYCDVYGNFRPVKTSRLTYEFSHPSFPNINIVISRYKVLRLCKLLKDKSCWINQDSMAIDKENTILSAVIKDTIVSDTEVIVLRMAIREILNHGFIKVPAIKNDTNDRRGAR